ncbi:hypothetical protein J6590_001916 [Homalodisca vitripennis]|nr:hypothetical protein J6590_001916 [Homalodisca vitripennis]
MVGPRSGLWISCALLSYGRNFYLFNLISSFGQVVYRYEGYVNVNSSHKLGLQRHLLYDCAARWRCKFHSNFCQATGFAQFNSPAWLEGREFWLLNRHRWGVTLALKQLVFSGRRLHRQLELLRGIINHIPRVTITLVSLFINRRRLLGMDIND